MPNPEEGLPLSPMRPGRYAGFQPIGEGGMGVVYLALDSELSREVALKLVCPATSRAATGTERDPLSIQPPPAGSELATEFEGQTARFLHEARITGGLEHPGIAPIYELGTTPAGVPYYAMRLIRGSRTLAEAIEECADRSLERRLALLEPFLRVCDAVAFAHARGVIHRDLKPANVALGEFGEAVLLDWGLAALQKDAPEQRPRFHERLSKSRLTAGFETHPDAIGTPGYMPPEAVLGDLEHIDPRSDVYSLGVILFEILTGRRPFEFETLYQYGVAVVREDAASPRSVRPDVPEALSRLCLAALARERDERPAGPDVLARAIRRWQASSQVEREIAGWLAEARRALKEAPTLPPKAALACLDRVVTSCSLIEQAQTGHAEGTALHAEALERREGMVRRRERETRQRLLVKFAVGVLVIAAGAALAVAGVLNKKNEDLENARGRAVDAQVEAEDASRVAETARGDAERARRVAERAQTQAEQERHRAVAERERAEELVQFLLFDLRDRLQRIGRLDLLKLVGDRVVGYYEEMPDEGTTVATRHRRATALLNAADVLSDLGRLQEAEVMSLRAKSMLEALQAKNPGASTYQGDIQVALGRLATIKGTQGRLDEAVALRAAAVEVCRGLLKEKPRNVGRLRSLSFTLRRLGSVHRRRREYQKARAALDEALQLLDRVLASFPEDQGALSGRADTLMAYVSLKQAQAQYDEAARDAQEVVKIYETFLRSEPGNVFRKADVAYALETYSIASRNRSDLARAITATARQVELRAQLAVTDPGNPQRVEDLAWAYIEAHAVARAVGSHDRAHYWIEKALALRKQLVERNPKHAAWVNDLAETLRYKALLLDDQLKPAESVPVWKQAHALAAPLDKKLFPNAIGYIASGLYAAESQLEDFEGIDEATRLRAFGQRRFGLGKNRVRAADWASALAHFRLAMGVPSVRSNLKRESLFVAARAAAQAAREAPGDQERERRARLALEWLEADFALLDEQGEEELATQHARALREDRVFAALRDYPEFKQLLR
ncbi:MAG: protein kinase [bacterium]|nr:protein kinase [bacterium]